MVGDGDAHRDARVEWFGRFSRNCERSRVRGRIVVWGVNTCCGLALRARRRQARLEGLWRCQARIQNLQGSGIRVQEIPVDSGSTWI